MKKCSYCGNEYPDDLSQCPIDKNQLSGKADTSTPDTLPSSERACNISEAGKLAIIPTPTSIIITHHQRLGPALYVLLGLASAYLGYWLPLWLDRIYPSVVDTRIGFVIAGAAPLTSGCAALAAYGYLKLWRLQRKSPTTAGRLLVVILFLPTCASALTGIYLAPTAIVMLPLFIRSLFSLFGL